MKLSEGDKFMHQLIAALPSKSAEQNHPNLVLSISTSLKVKLELQI